MRGLEAKLQSLQRWGREVSNFCRPSFLCLTLPPPSPAAMRRDWREMDFKRVLKVFDLKPLITFNIQTYNNLKKNYLRPILKVTTATHIPCGHMIAFQVLNNQLAFIIGCSISWSCDHDLQHFFPICSNHLPNHQNGLLATKVTCFISIVKKVVKLSQVT